MISDLRGIEQSEDQQESDRLFKLVDLVKDEGPIKAEIDPKDVQKVDEITCNGVPMVKLAEEEYVYDVYTMQSDAFSSTDSDNSFGDFDKMDIVDISFLDCLDMEAEKEYRDGFENDSDSNDENNWRNDYPDEEEFSDDEDDAYYRDDDLDLDFER